jgi:hypothetical protein
MGRTVDYHIYSDLERDQIPVPARRRILRTQNQMNHRFSWRAERIWLEFLEHPNSATTSARPRLGGGFTKVYEDEWNVVLVVRFLQWVSEQLPKTCFICLSDEGDYIIPGSLLIRGGKHSLDQTAIDEARQRLIATGDERLAEFDKEVAALRQGSLFKHVLALDYQEYSEISKLRQEMKTEQFDGLTLEDAADRIVFPWTTAQPKAA